MKFLNRFFIIYIFFSKFLLSQDNYFSSYLALPMNKLFDNFEYFIDKDLNVNKRFSISYNYNEIINNGHTNIDNFSTVTPWSR